MNSFQQIGVIALSGAILALSSCSTGGNSPSGFLTNFSQLDAGYGTDNAVAVYVNPKADLKKYDSIIIDPVTTVVAAPNVSPAVTNQLAAYLSSSMRSELSGKIKIVSTPSPTTLRIRAALSDVTEKPNSSVPVSAVHNDPKITLTGNVGSDAVASLIKNIAFEGEIVNSLTGERLGALCDNRSGVKREATASTPWSSVRNTVNQGAVKLCKRILAAQAR
ncbi:MAG: DUF3313 domain-containing protein [Gloeobacteraceae cyanobacterium ES-bin-144]|nr:DUF3313 domain-containing protein [Verrucomicrobiales bacterium]